VLNLRAEPMLTRFDEIRDSSGSSTVTSLTTGGTADCPYRFNLMENKHGDLRRPRPVRSLDQHSRPRARGAPIRAGRTGPSQDDAGIRAVLPRRTEIAGSVKLERAAFLSDSGAAFEYQRDGKWYRYTTYRKPVEISTPTVPDSLRRGRFAGRGGGPGRQLASADSPDGKRKAFYRDRNLG
jgi:hypothetical protein